MFAGGVLQSATGFGFSMLTSPLLLALLGPQQAVTASSILGLLLSGLLLAGEGRRPDVARRDASLLVAFSLPGLAIGAVAVRVLSVQVLALMMAVGVLGGLAARVRSRRAAPRPVPAWSAPASGLASGVLSTSTGISGPPLIFHLLARGLEPSRMRDTLAAVFASLGVLSFAALVIAGSLDVPGAIPYFVVAAIAGQVAGRGLFARMRPEAYEPVVLGVLLCAAGVAVVSAFA
ncbi:MAG: uncharacterized protein QOG77_907 [Solirubrobacteraceae bacterium]|nr:uncharacterized protein [Solirubrobacteraceae bacterium]